jgi:hypothetical protein
MSKLVLDVYSIKMKTTVKDISTGNGKVSTSLCPERNMRLSNNN